MRRIFLDLDGPLFDVAERYHRLHCDLVRKSGGEPLAREAYWDAKRARVPEAQILARTGLPREAAAAVAAVRLHRIETRRYLGLDRPWPWTIPTLAELARLGPLVLVTLRRHADRLAWQLQAHGLRGYFDRVVAGAGDETPAAKAALLLEARLGKLDGSVFVGDTEIDIASGRALGLATIAVRCGIRDEAHLAAWQPDVLLDDLRQLPGCLSSLGWPTPAPP